MFLTDYQVKTEIEARKLLTLINKSNKSRRELERLKKANKAIDVIRRKGRERKGQISMTFDSYCNDFSTFVSTTPLKSSRSLSGKGGMMVEGDYSEGEGEWIRNNDGQVPCDDHYRFLDNDGACCSFDSMYVPKLTKSWRRQLNVVSRGEGSYAKQCPASPPCPALSFSRKRSFLYLDGDSCCDQLTSQSMTIAGDRNVVSRGEGSYAEQCPASPPRPELSFSRKRSFLYFDDNYFCDQLTSQSMSTAGGSIYRDDLDQQEIEHLLEDSTGYEHKNKYWYNSSLAVKSEK